ncbi:TolB family protein [Streptomyces sp. NPDC001678]|uniref:TolB family protein n=1 Tax=Streptomyces sp. NPDC001678 TaxID=3364599 RepID=UPI00368CAE56
MRYFRRVAVVATAWGSLATALPLATAVAAEARPQPRTERVNTASDGTQANAETLGAKVSADGRFVTFESRATTLVPGTAKESRRVYVKDLRTGRTELASVASDGTPADDQSWTTAISGDGRYVVFDSQAKNLAPNRNPGDNYDVFVRDRATGRTEVLVENKGTKPAHSSSPSISADGRYVAFSSSRDDLVPGDTNGQTDVFVRDRWQGTTERVSVMSDGTQAEGFSLYPVISADGSRVAFLSMSDLVAPAGGQKALQRPRARALYVHDLRTGRTERGAQSLDGGPVAVTGGFGLSPDGRYALFSSASASVVENDTNGKDDAFAKDLVTGVTRRLSLAADGSQADQDSYGGIVMSADNRRVFFTSLASNLVPGDTNGVEDVFAKDLVTGAVERVSVAADGAQADGHSGEPDVDLAGRTLVFGSAADNLVPGDTNKYYDTFVRRIR